MPLTPINYTNTIMYKLVCNDINIIDCYIGHTTNFTNRKSHHKSRVSDINDKRYYSYIYSFIRENGGWENWNMIKIEDYSCKSFLDACKRERELIEVYKATLNTNRPFRTYEENIDLCKLSKKEYKINNKKKTICDCGGSYDMGHKSRHFRTQKHITYITSLNEFI